jgi:hypothetical protein
MPPHEQCVFPGQSGCTSEERPSIVQKNRRLRKSSRHAFVVAGIVTAFLVTGCSTQERVCEPEEYPVKAVEGTGGSCVANGKEPPKGSVRYPKGKVPEYVDDKWDKYWRKVVFDKNGHIVKTKVVDKNGHIVKKK